MQTLRKKGSPCKYRNDPGRFFGEGVAFKAKLIGILEVGEARGDRMCQEALQDLKIAIRAAGEHKQRISIHVTIDGLRLRDEKTGDSLYHHPVHKISFIAQDMTDSRAFGYIYGSPDSGHRFFGIKTDKAASQVVLAMRDLFQVVFELKKKEIELARQTIQTKAILGGSTSSNSTVPGLAGADRSAGRNDLKSSAAKVSNIMDETSFMAGASAINNGCGAQMGDLVDLELELSCLQRGITQMDKITPNEPAPNTNRDEEDPFGDSFATSKPGSAITGQLNILPPPPDSTRGSSKRELSKGQQQVQQIAAERKDNDWSPPLLPPPGTGARSKLPSTSSPNPNANWLADEAAVDSLFDGKDCQEWERENEYTCGRTSTGPVSTSKEDTEKFADAFIDLDPLGTGKNKPYVDKKFFFQDVKNPPKKVLKELSNSDMNFMVNFMGNPMDFEPNDFNSSGESTSFMGGSVTTQAQRKTSSGEEHPRYAEPHSFTESGRNSVTNPQLNYFEPFEDPFEMDQQPVVRAPKQSPATSSPAPPLSVPLKVILPPETNRSRGSSPRNRSPNLVRERGSDVVKKPSYDSTRRVRQSPIDSVGFDAAPDPPPRPEIVNYTDPPPLPPKKSLVELGPRTSNRPSLSNFKMSTTTTTTSHARSTSKSNADAPPLPLPSRKVTHSDSRYPGPARPQKQEEDGYLIPTDSHMPVLLPPPKGTGSSKRVPRKSVASPGQPENDYVTPSLSSGGEGGGVEAITEITLSQLLQLSIEELADKLSVSVEKLSTMTVVELTKYLSEFLTKGKEETVTEHKLPPKSAPVIMQKAEPSVFKVSFDDDKDATFTAVFDDRFGEEDMSTMAEFVADFDNANIQMAANSSVSQENNNSDRYAVFREIFDEELKGDTGPEEEPDSPIEVTPRSEDPPMVCARIDTSITNTIAMAKDRYAALRDIVLEENLFESDPPKAVSPIDLMGDEIFDAEGTTEIGHEVDVSVGEYVPEDEFESLEQEQQVSPQTHFNIEPPEQERVTDYEIKDKSVTPTFMSARDDLEIDELMKLAVSNLSLNNINSLSPQTTHMQLKNASTSPILLGQHISNSPIGGDVAAEPRCSVMDTSTSPIIMPIERVSPQPVSPLMHVPIAHVTPPIEDAEANIQKPNSCQEQEVVDTEIMISTEPAEEKWSAFEEPAETAQPVKTHTESPCSSDEKDELKVLKDRKWARGHTSSSSRDVSPRDASPWDDEFGEGNCGGGGGAGSGSVGRRRVSPGVASDRQGHYMRHGRRISCEEDYDYEAGKWHYGNKYGGGGDRVNWPPAHPRDAMKARSGRTYEKRKFYSSHSRKTYDYDEGGEMGVGGVPFDIGAPVSRSGGSGNSSRDRIKREYHSHSNRERRSLDRESNDSYDSGSGGNGDVGGGVGGPVLRKARREYRNEYYGSIELMPDEYDLDVNKKRYASLEKGHKGNSGSVRRSSSRRSNSDAYDDYDESEDGDCHYRVYNAEVTRSLQRGSGRQMQLPPHSGVGNSNNKSRRGGGGSSPWDSKPSPIYGNSKVSWSARPSSASENTSTMDRHRYFSTQALTVGSSDTEKDRRQRLKGRSATSTSTVQLSGPQSAQQFGHRYGSEFAFEDDEGVPRKGAMRKALRKEGSSRYSQEAKDGGSNRKLNMSPLEPPYSHSRYERTNSRPQPLEGKYYHHPPPPGHYRYNQSPHQQMNEENEGCMDGGGLDDMEQQGFESDFLATSPVKSSGSFKNRPMFRFSTDYSNNNSPGVDSSPSGSGPNNGQPRLRFNENVKVTNYSEDKSDSLESPPGKNHFEDDFSEDQWDKKFPGPPPSTRAVKDIRKSESVNIFAKKSDDPFEDDDFFKSSDGAFAEHSNWNNNFAKFDDNNAM